MSKYYQFLNLPENFVNIDMFINEYSKTVDINKNGHWRLEGEKLNLLSNNV